jgi:hypothetical protein
VESSLPRCWHNRVDSSSFGILRNQRARKRVLTEISILRKVKERSIERRAKADGER